MTPTPRLTLLAAIAALALVGCQKSPFAWTLDFVPTIAAGKPTAPGTAPSAGATPAPGATATPGGVATPTPAAPATGTPAPGGTPTPAAEATPIAEPSFAPLDPAATLPPATTISDLPPADQQAVTQALASDEVMAYLPDQLIHDGGVVLYRTLAVEQPRLQVGTQLADRPKGPPPKWARAEEARSGAQTVARQVPCPPGQACISLNQPINVVVRYHQKSKFAFKTPEGQLVEKPYGELFRRRLEFDRQEGGKLKLRAASPITIESQGGRSGLEIGQVHLFGAPPEPIFVLRDDDHVFLADRQPRLRAGERGRIEVDVQSRRPGEFFVFASMAGQGPDKRVFLRDDGQAPDMAAGDFRYTGAFETPDKAGLNHVVVDVMDAKTFLPIGPYRSYSLAFSFLIDPR